MSIVITLGVTTPETSYSDMAAGSDPESVEASPAVNEKNYNNHSCGSAQNHGYRGLPYAMQQSSVVCCQDHNYGAPPPPTPPASPLSQTIIPRMELNGMVRSSHYHEPRAEHSADSDSSSEEDAAVTSWCRCSPTPDGAHLKCTCRELDRRKGVEGAHRKQENVSAGESSATESGDEEVSPSTVSYTATQHTPTSIKLTVNRVKRSKSKKRKKSTERGRGTPKPKKVKAFRQGSRKSMRMKNSTSEASVLDENTAEGWESRIRQWTDQYEEALSNQYSADIQTLLELHRSACASVSKAESGASTPPSDTQTQACVNGLDTINRTELACNNTVLGSQMQLQLGRVTRVQKHRKILRAARNLEADTLIIEYRGKVMLRQQFEVNGHFFKKPYPFVLFYSKFNDVEMCVDARTFGNDARFIRRSCTPNAEVRHMIAEGMIHLCIYAVCQIAKDAEVTIGFDYEFSSCNYKVDCACHKGNQNCPVQKHNLSPMESFLNPTALALPSPAVGTETRRRKAQRKELESCLASNGTLTPDQQPEGKDLQGVSDTEERTLTEVKAEDGEVDENGIGCSKRAPTRRRATGAEVKDEAVDTEDRTGNAPETPSVPHGSGVGVSTRRTTYFTDNPPGEDKPPAATLPAPPAPPKPTRPTKPRPKSRISRYRSSSSQRARRQRQALAHQAAAAAAAAAAAMSSAQAMTDQGAALHDEGSQCQHGAEHGHGDGGQGAHLLDGDAQGPNSIQKGSVRYPKTKKYLVTEWLNDKVPGGEKLQQEVPVERPLRITTDPTVLATTLNMLPGLSHSSLICTAPRHYVRFGSPFTPERRRPRPLQMDGTYGCYKKRWIKQVEDESCSNSVEDGTESTSSQQSTSSRSTPNPLCSDAAAPFKKRHHKYAADTTPASSDHLLRPLSPITPPLPEDSLHLLLHPPCGSVMPNGLVYSPMPSQPTSRCNTPLQFEDISSSEASPVHRPESISPEPSLQADFDASRPPFLDLSLPSSLESPRAVTSDDFPGATSGQDSQGQSSVGGISLNLPLYSSSDSKSREKAFRTEFNLIYTCSPLNANLGNPLSSERHHSQVDGAFSPADSFHSSLSGQGLVGDVGSGSLSPFGESHYGAAYPDRSTSPHTSNPPQKKKRANQHTISLLTGKAEYQPIAVRSENKPVHNMVSLLEYRKRKQGSSSRACEPAARNAAPTQPDPYCSKETHPARSYQQMQPPSSPHSTAPVPHLEEVSPPDHHRAPVKPRRQECSNQWMVPTTVERLREGQRVLRSIKMDRVYRRSDGSADAEPDVERYERRGGALVASTKSPHRYSPPLYAQQSAEVLPETDGPSFTHPTASSPFQSSSTQSFYPRISSSHPGPSQDPQSSYCSPPPTQPGSDGPPSYSSSRLKTGFLSSSSLLEGAAPGPRTQGQTKVDVGPQASRGSQQQVAVSLKVNSPGQAGQPAGSRLTGPSPHYPQQFQHPPHQGPGVRTQSGSF
ncbi:histone-lysine N-methyltransferase SETD5 isoform X1 [Gambusia affinis]|uniref:histone-lysine N-methyltransferase SETD5 isoform X1 n=2 Tax=Gambusia affinis TaxID=33528 RepID=UPI001CDC22C3|nr:histone-lysine N-methyltransferase SETD5 isoform X1 [Gambusia affinis]